MAHQLSFFDPTYPDPHEMLKSGAALVISFSAGKDSQAMLIKLLQMRKLYNWTGEAILFHNDLGRAEWPQTPAVVTRQAAIAGLPLVVVRRVRDGVEFDLFDEEQLRRKNMDAAGKVDKPHWYSSGSRYCTKHQKEQPCDTWIRERFPQDANVVVVMGLRDQESTARAKKPTVWKRESFAPTLNRHVYNWLPIRELDLSEVWETIGYTMGELKEWQVATKSRLDAGESAEDVIAWLMDNFKAHPAYALGNSRLSCSHCMLATENDLRNGAQFHTEAYRYLTRREMETGFSFKGDLWLCSLRPDLLDDDVRAWYEKKLEAA